MRSFSSKAVKLYISIVKLLNFGDYLYFVSIYDLAFESNTQCGNVRSEALPSSSHLFRLNMLNYFESEARD